LNGHIVDEKYIKQINDVEYIIKYIEKIFCFDKMEFSFESDKIIKYLNVFITHCILLIMK
jgi:hypothetical protein